MLQAMANDNVKQYETGECIFREGESGDLMYVLIEGAVDLKKRLGRGETVLKIVDKPNDFFGEMAILDDRPRSATAIAAKPTKVIAVDARTFESMILGNGKFALKIIKVLSDRIRRSNDQVSDLIETMPRERVARGMADYARRHGERIHDGSTKVSYEAMKLWINSRLGIAPEEIETAVVRLLKISAISWAATSSKTKEHIILSEHFIVENDRRDEA